MRQLGREIRGNIVTYIEENNSNSINTDNNITNENDVLNENTSTSNVIGNKLADIFAKMTKEEIDMYNISFTGYSGQNMKGQMVKVLLEAVYTSNANHIGVEGLFVAVTQNYDKDLEATIGEPGNRKNTEEVVKKCNEKLDDLKDSTNAEDDFNIECVYDSGIVVEVKITKLK